MDITHQQVIDAFSYDPVTGVLSWKNPTSNRVRKGAVCGTPDKDGYLQVGFMGKYLKTHRVIFLYMTGNHPQYEIDHINGDVTDNRWVNLRDATKHQNSQNTKLTSRNTSGVKGVSWCNQKRKWRCLVISEGKYIHAGYFSDIQRATDAVRAARIKVHKQFVNHG